MTYLLDVSALLALLWETHEFNERVTRWQENESVAICPITELGYLRISTQPAFGLSPTEARRALREEMEMGQSSRLTQRLRNGQANGDKGMERI